MMTPGHHIEADPTRHVIVVGADNNLDPEDAAAVDRYVRSVLAGHGYEPVGEWGELTPDPHLGFQHRRFGGSARSIKQDTGPAADDLGNWFTYHPPRPEQISLYETLRDAGRVMAEHITDCAPPSRERSTALAKVREAVMWANAAIACNERDT